MSALAILLHCQQKYLLGISHVLVQFPRHYSCDLPLCQDIAFCIGVLNFAADAAAVSMENRMLLDFHSNYFINLDPFGTSFLTVIVKSVFCPAECWSDKSSCKAQQEKMVSICCVPSVSCETPHDSNNFLVLLFATTWHKKFRQLDLNF